MNEEWEVLDVKGNNTGITVTRREDIPKGYYHLGADVWIVNSENKIFIQKRSDCKQNSPNVWAMTGGSVIKGETSLQTIERETREELGIQLNIDKALLLKKVKTGNVWIDTYFIRQDIDLSEIRMQKEEVSECRWAAYDEVEKLVQEGQFIENRWEFVKEIIKECIDNKN